MSIVARGDFKCAHPGHTLAIAQQLNHQWRLEERAQLETEARAAKMKRDESMELVGFAIGDRLLTNEQDPLFQAIKTMHERLKSAKDARRWAVELESQVSIPSSTPSRTSNNQRTNNNPNPSTPRGSGILSGKLERAGGLAGYASSSYRASIMLKENGAEVPVHGLYRAPLPKL